MCWRRALPFVRSVSALDKQKNVPETGKAKIRKPGTRRLVQLYAALLYNANLKGFIDGHIYSGSLKAACVPGLNCYSCPGAIASCPLGALQNALNAAGHTAPWYILGILALFGVILGRTICGWVCPLGLIQELLHKIPTPKLRKSRATRTLSCLKYVILAVFVVAIPLIYGVVKGVILPGFCKYICPAGTLEGAVGVLQNPANSSSFFQLKAVFTSKWVIMLVIGLASVFCYRSFCLFLCPLGAIYGFFNRFAITGVKVNPDRCNGCGQCVRKCQMDVRHVGDRECISCGKCIDACAQGAIALKCGKITLMGPEIGKNADPKPVIEKRKRNGRIAWGVLLAILLFALAWFNLIEPAINKAKGAGAAVTGTQAENSDTDLVIGTDIGCLAPDFATDLISGDPFQLSKHRGQVVIINIWATTCAPCIEELPYYEQLKT
ncbi:MAG: 4Fe-4S binding protein, partial [Clostridia bacterium]|nr:4Fe-4S binding protein [Clostridia bacterium]